MLIAKTVFTWLASAVVLILCGCVSVSKERDGKYIKPVHVEYRSPFGTNDSFAKLQRCDGPTRPVLFYMEGDFSSCVDLTPEEQARWSHGYSQGQGGQILGAAATLGGFGWLAQSQQGLSLATSATATGGSALVNIRNGKTGRW